MQSLPNTFVSILIGACLLMGAFFLLSFSVAGFTYALQAFAGAAFLHLLRRVIKGLDSIYEALMLLRAQQKFVPSGRANGAATGETRPTSQRVSTPSPDGAAAMERPGAGVQRIH